MVEIQKMKQVLQFWREGKRKEEREIRDTNKDTENEGYHGVCVECMKRNGISSDCCHTFPISGTESSVCICLLYFCVIDFNLYVTSLLGDVVALLEDGCLPVCSTKEALCCVNSAVL